jgi:CMP-N,N'-diacetyllegionaminic acid synthase
MKKILITLCARGGSKGVPMKNIKLLHGKPLIQYSIDTAKKFAISNQNDCTLALSTDDDLILNTAKEFGLETNYKRPEYLATDSAGKVDTIAHLLAYEENERGLKYDYVLDLDVSAPLRSVEDLNNAFKIVENDKDVFNLFSVSKAHRSPYFNMVESADDGYFQLVKPLSNSILARQNAPIVYDLNASFYFYKRVFFEHGFKSVMSPKALIYEVPHICFDIDNLIDFDIMEFLISNHKLDFDL